MARVLAKPELSDGGKIERLARGFQVCEKQSSKLASLLDELLDLTRIRLGKLTLTKEQTDLTAICREVAERFRAEPTPGASGLRLVEDGPVRGHWDPTRIEQVITNLVSNAIKYGDEKPAEIKIFQSPDGQSAVLEVHDEGIGIPEDMREKIFQRFERAVEGDSISGLGLGLYITRQIVEAHGGKITVESDLGRGSVFRVHLPCGKEAAKPN